ncbi:hypothetical protein XarjCFBP7653_06265 [Xanthomonas arboricola]|nr:hypothetical protein XarjCFBP7653_06265 [Xanthomonas arboricola]
MLCSQSCVPTISPGPCPPTVAGPYAAWMPRKSLHGRTCGVSCEGGRARALQPSHKPAALQRTQAAAIQVLASAASQPAVRQWAPVTLSR